MRSHASLPQHFVDIPEAAYSWYGDFCKIFSALSGLWEMVVHRHLTYRNVQWIQSCIHAFMLKICCGAISMMWPNHVKSAVLTRVDLQQSSQNISGGNKTKLSSVQNVRNKWARYMQFLRFLKKYVFFFFFYKNTYFYLILKQKLNALTLGKDCNIKVGKMNENSMYGMQSFSCCLLSILRQLCHHSQYETIY